MNDEYKHLRFMDNAVRHSILFGGHCFVNIVLLANNLLTTFTVQMGTVIIYQNISTRQIFPL